MRAAAVAAAAALRFLDLGGLKHRASAWVAARRLRLEWAAVSARVVFFNYQIVVKYTQLQSVRVPPHPQLLRALLRPTATGGH